MCTSKNNWAGCSDRVFTDKCFSLHNVRSMYKVAGQHFQIITHGVLQNWERVTRYLIMTRICFDELIMRHSSWRLLSKFTTEIWSRFWSFYGCLVVWVYHQMVWTQSVTRILYSLQIRIRRRENRIDLPLPLVGRQEHIMPWIISTPPCCVEQHTPDRPCPTST